MLLFCLIIYIKKFLVLHLSWKILRYTNFDNLYIGISIWNTCCCCRPRGAPTVVPPPAILAPDPTPAGPTSGPAAPLLTSLGSSVSPRIFGSLFVGSVVLFILCSAVVVECLRLNPCLCGGMIIFFVMYGRMIFSSVLAVGESSAMGL